MTDKQLQPPRVVGGPPLPTPIPFGCRRTVGASAVGLGGVYR